MDLGIEVTTIREAIDSMANAQPETVFLISPETGVSVSFQQLQQQSILLSNMLSQAGLESGDKIAFLMDNGLLTAQLFLGTMYGGFVTVPLNVRAGAMQLSYMLDHCDAKIVFVEEQYSPLLNEAMADVRRSIRVIPANADGPLPAFETPAEDFTPLLPCPDTVSLLMYSSGSTGKPKAAIHTHSSILAHGRNSIESHQLTSADRSLLVLPFYHINAECVTLTPTLLCGGSVVVAHRFVVSKFWDWVDDLHVTWSALVPTIISELVDWDDPGKDRRQEAFQRIRFFRSSSAPLSPQLHRQFIDKFKLPLLQAMGSTEGGNVFSNPQPPGKNKIGSPGLPWGFEARIVDREGADVPQGESGEVLLRGAALMKGYYKDPEGTAAVVDSNGWLHTGDLARRDEDGYFFIVGRSKELIIKGGVNIAPRQIDEVLESHPAVLEAAAVGVPDRYFGEDAVAFVVLRSACTADEKELLAFCETRLGHFKAPSRIHFLKELPKGPSGKVQRLRLLDPDVLSIVAASTQQASSTAAINGNGHRSEAQLPSSVSSIEKIIADAWAHVLSVPEVDAHANFFALGGHSLLAIQCLSKLRERLPIVLSLADFFENSTIAEQAQVVRQRLRLTAAADGQLLPDESSHWEQMLLERHVPQQAEDAIPRLESTLPQPLSPAQQRIWFLEQLNPPVPVYNESEAVRLTGELNVDALETALNVIVDRHELLRSTIRLVDGVPHAVIHESWPLRFKIVDLSALPDAERQAEVDRLLIAEPSAPYDLEAEPGIRVTLLHLGAREHVLILMMHHIIGDWSSEGIIWREFSALYGSLISGNPVGLPALRITHGDYAAWQKQRLAGKSLDEDLAFWEQTLHGAPPLLDLPADRPRPAIMTCAGKRLRWILNRSLAEALRNTSRQERTSLFTIFAAAFDTLLHRYTGSEDILLGIPLADRDRPELQSVIGFLLHTHVLRTKLSPGMTFRDLLRRVQKAVLDLYIHRSAPFDQILRRLHPERNPSYTPLFQVMLNWRDRDQQLSFIGMAGLAIESLISASNTSKFDLGLQATDNGDEIWLELEYSTDLFDQDRMTRLLGHYQTLLEGVAADPGAILSEMPLLTPSERHEVLDEWNDTSAGFPRDKCAHQLFEEQALKTPQATAVVFEGDSLSYAELNSRANQLAHELRELGIGPDARVAICVERGFEMVASVLAVLKAGGAYVPLDPAYPVERLRFMLEDSAPVALLTEGHLEALFSGIGERLRVLDLADATPPWRTQPETNLDPETIGLKPNHLAYVIYTSGSTGQPKGVMIEHRGLCNLITAQIRSFAVEADSRVLQISSFSFDAWISEAMMALRRGAALHLLRQDHVLTGDGLTGLVARHGITHVTLAPAVLAALPEQADFPSIRVLVVAGDTLTAALAKRWNRGRLLIDAYGPTEATVCATVHCCREEESGNPPIGRPIANVRVYILDAHREPVPVGVAGELYIGGAGVARGYLNRPELTAERFVDDPFAAEPGARMYKTGDLGRWLADGNIEFLGRNDFQVKVRGFRIELGEIESVLQQHPGIAQCAVISQTDDQADRRLVAYFVPADPHSVPAVEDLRRTLNRQLPGYMVPAAFVAVNAIPLTPNGKIDRKALSAVKNNHAAFGSSRQVVAPSTPTELLVKQLWEQILGVSTLGVDDNFFESGGHSLLAMRLSTAIGNHFHVHLPLRDLFFAPTIRAQARLIDASSENRPHELIVPVQLGDSSRPPLFMIHGYHLYPLLPQRLGSDQTFYGIQEYAPGEWVGDWTLESMMARYVREIRSVQPHGPYFIAGFCSSALPAFEVARQLAEANEPIGRLVIVDAVGRMPESQTQKQGAVGARIRPRFKFKELKVPPAAELYPSLKGFVAEKIRHQWMKIERWSFSQSVRFCLDHGIQIPTFLRKKMVGGIRVVTIEAIRRYSIKPYNGDIDVMLTAEFESQLSASTFRPWEHTTSGKVRITFLPGDHITAFTPPKIDVFAEKLRSILDAALEEYRSTPDESEVNV